MQTFVERYTSNEVFQAFKATTVSVAIVAAAAASAQTANSTGCDAYPYQPNDTLIEFGEDGKFKIVTTAAAYVDFDDGQVVASAEREAELLGKRLIAEYINQKLTSEDSIESAINTSRTLTGSTTGGTLTTTQREEVKTQLSSISGRADALLVGVSTLGGCYTKGHQVRVTVGIKSDTFQNAQKLGTVMGAAAASNYGQNNPKSEQGQKQTTDRGQQGVQTGTKDYTGGQAIRDY